MNPAAGDEESREDDAEAFLSRKKLFEVDYVGNETFVISELNLLARRSDEPNKCTEAKLSARGLFHRTKEHHKRDLLLSNAVISSAQKRDSRGKKGKVSSQLLPPLFQRALARERFHQLEDAIADYTMILSIDHSATAYFNRSNLYCATGRPDLALADLNSAIALEPANFAFRNNKALLLRQRGDYMEAINETMVGRAILTIPEYVNSQLASGTGEILINSNALRKLKPPMDPIVAFLSLPREERPEKGVVSVIDFLSRLKFFAPFAADHALMTTIAGKVELCRFAHGDAVFEEGMLGEHFYMVLDGEVQIVRCKKDQDGFVKDTTVLVTLFRGQTFGETAIESATGLRTAGAIASSKTGTKLLAMHVDDYKQVILGYKLVLRGEVKTVLQSCPAFRELTDGALNTLAEQAVLRNFGSNTEIQKAGEPSHVLFIVKQGIVKLGKTVPKPSVGDIKVTFDSSSVRPFVQTPGLWVLEKSFSDPKQQSPAQAMLDASRRVDTKGPTVDMTVGVLASGQLFGELAVLSPGAPSPLSARSFTPSEVYCFTGEAILAAGAKFSTACMSALEQGISLHNPPAEKLAYYFREKFAAETLKIGALETMKTYAERDRKRPTA